MLGKWKLPGFGILVLFLGGAAWLLATTKPAGHPNSTMGTVESPEIHPGIFRVFAAGARGSRIAGRVLDPEGKPFADAELTAIRDTQDQRLGDQADIRLRAVVRSDPKGEFIFALRSPGAYIVTASASGFAPGRANVVVADASERTVTITLIRGGVVLRGRVEDSSGGPISGAQVFAGSTASGYALVRTDGRGMYEHRLAPSRYAVHADADGYAPQRQTVDVSSDAEQNFLLHPAARVSGRVVEGASSKVVSEATVRAVLQGDVIPLEITSDAAGEFLFSDLNPGRYLISAAKGNLVGFSSGPVAVALADHVADVIINLEPGYSISGSVLDTRNQSLPSAQIRMREIREGSLVSGSDSGSVVALTDVSGRYRIDGVLPGHFALAADAVPNAPSEWRDVLIKKEDATQVNFVMIAGGELLGTVLGPDGKPVPDCKVMTEVRAGDSVDSAVRAWRRSRTSSNGRFVAKGLAAGLVNVTADHPQFGMASLSPMSLSVAEKKEVTVRFQKGAFIRGTVQYGDGVVAASVNVRWDGTILRSTFTDNDGKFEIGPLPSGRGTLKAEVTRAQWTSHGGPDEPDRKGLVVVSGQDLNGIALVVTRQNEAISGTVLSPDGHPLEGALIETELEQPGLSAFNLPTVSFQTTGSGVSGREGHFAIRDLRKSRYWVRAVQPRFPATEPVSVDAPAAGIQLRFDAGARLSGKAVSENGAPVTSFEVEVVSAQAPDSNRSGPSRNDAARRSVNHPAGVFEVDALKAGRYEVVVSTAAGGAGRIAGIDLRAGESRENLVVTVAGLLRLKGRIVDADTRKGIVDMTVTVTPAREQVLARTDMDGAFVLERLVPGRTIRIQARGAERGYVPETRDVALPENRTEFDIDPILLLRIPSSDALRGADLSSGLRLSQGESLPRVLDVPPNSAAARAGLVSGAVIQAIDGRDMTGYGEKATLTLLRGTPGTQVSVEFQLPNGARQTAVLAR
jgi:protocatechuate 3,4-dioxygenase beta subunit